VLWSRPGPAIELGVAFPDWVESELRSLGESGLLRDPADDAARGMAEASARDLGVAFLDVSSNDYLGFARQDVSRETLNLPPTCPQGAGASRLVHGTHALHTALEHDLANWAHLPAALLFTSGYAANSGIIPALAHDPDAIFSDSLNHASIIDGCRLSKAKTLIYPHLDLAALRAQLKATPARHRWVITESYFSMDGDSPNLPALRDLCREFSASLLVDEAHALGVFGPKGSGLCAANRVAPHVLVGTLGKAVGLQGAFVATSNPLRTWLWNRARTLVFSTAPSPLLALLLSHNLLNTRSADDARATLHANANRVRRELTAAGLTLPAGNTGPILPILLCTPTRAIRAATRLRAQGILAQAIRPPTVPPNTSRLRITIPATLTPPNLDYLIPRLIDACAAS